MKYEGITEVDRVEFWDEAAAAFFTPERVRWMELAARKALSLAVLMIHAKGQGHLAATASAIHIMTAVYFCRAREMLACAAKSDALPPLSCDSQKPHAVPGWDGLLYLEGLFTKEQIQAFRTFHGPNAYPTHEDPGIQIPTGSLGMGPSAAIGVCCVDEYNAAHGVAPHRGLQISIIGDAEFDEGVIHESIKERASHGLTGWLEFIDYNRQSLDGNLEERLVDRIAHIYAAHHLPVVILKYGTKLQTLFRKHVAGRELRRRIDALSTEDYQALLRQTGGVIRRVLTLSIDAFEAFMQERRRNINEFLADVRAESDPSMEALFKNNTDAEVKEILANLGGHDIPLLASVIENVRHSGSCALVIAYTVKGWSIEPLAGSLSGHWQQLTPEQHAAYWEALGPEIVDPRDPWAGFAETHPARQLFREIAAARQTLAACYGMRRERPTPSPRSFPVQMPLPPEYSADEPVSTQEFLGQVFTALCQLDKGHPLAEVAERMVTMAADVGYTAGLKDWMNAKGVWGPEAWVDVMSKYGEHPEVCVQPRPSGQHIRLSNLEQFLGLLAAAFGKSASLGQAERYPFAFFYDVFLERMAEMFKYAAYWDARVFFLGTICGASAPGESGLHHGSMSAVIGRMTPNVVVWEPAFPLELSWILAEELRRAVDHDDAGRRVRYIRATATPVVQSTMWDCLRRQGRFVGWSDEAIADAVRPEVIQGGYCLLDQRRLATADRQVHILAAGTSVHEALHAAGRLTQAGVAASVFVVTSPTLLLHPADLSQLARLFPEEGRATSIPVVTVTDSHSLYLEGVAERLTYRGRVPVAKALGVHTFDRSGTADEIKRFHHIDAAAIASAAQEVLHRVQTKQ